MIQASSIAAAVFEEPSEVVDELFPHRLGEDAPDDETGKIGDAGGGGQMGNRSDDGDRLYSKH